MTDALLESDAQSVAHCLMPNHFHWALATGRSRFDRIVHRLLTRHAVRFNRLHGRSGHLFEQRHWSFLCESPERIEDAIAYIHMNPVRAGLVRTPADWKWSSATSWNGEAPSTSGLERLAEISGKSIPELKSAHQDRITSELEGGRRYQSPRELIADITSLLGLSPDALMGGARGELVTKAKRIIIERAEGAEISLVAVAKELKCAPSLLYVLKTRRP